MNIILLVASFLCLTINGIQPPTDIPKKFVAQGGMAKEDPIELASFADMASHTDKEHPFFLAVIPAGNNYSFYNFSEIERMINHAQPPYKDPQNSSQKIETLFLYKYTGGDHNFPFKYVKSMNHEDLKNQAPFDDWSLKMRKQTADFSTKLLLDKFKMPTLEDLKQLHTILEVPFDQHFVTMKYQQALQHHNWLARRLAKESGRTYTDEQLRQFIRNTNFPLEQKKLRELYDTRHTRTLILSAGTQGTANLRLF